MRTSEAKFELTGSHSEPLNEREQSELEFSGVDVLAELHELAFAGRKIMEHVSAE